MSDPAITVEQRHRDAAADFLGVEINESWGLPSLANAFARFDTERTAELERQIAGLKEALQYIHDRPFPHPGEATFYLDTIRRVARTALQGEKT